MQQPVGTVTLFFSDIEGSTRLLHELGPEQYREALSEHRRVMRAAFERHGGYEVDYEGDAFFVAFADAGEAAAAATEGQETLGGGPIRVRIGLHTGEPILDAPKYVGMDVHLAARVMGAGHGGQVLLTEATRVALGPSNSLLLGDLGEHRLKDIDAPVPLFQLGDGSFPPLKTISNTNLPRPAPSFVGRETEVASVAALAREARLVTLTGPGGTGKTRLAIETAAELVGEFKAGVFWIGLATVRDPALVTETIAQSLGAKDELAAHVGDRELLLLLDNFEQVADAAPALSSLLQTCPNLRLLVTTRERLRIDGEAQYAVPPLASSEAVELFCARSRLDPDETIGELCRRLDDMPLAVELAAARTAVLMPAQILERLSQRLDLLKGGRDRYPRQQTLRATIEWSYDLLDPTEQELFARLSVFVGGCTLEAAEEVAGADPDSLQSLVDKSLVRFTNGRFWMLETIREYALERIEQSAEAPEVRTAHVRYFLAVVEALEPELRGGAGQEAAFDRLETELDNLRTALSFAFETEPGLLVRLVAAAGYFLIVHGHVEEGRRWSAQASLTGAGSPTARGRVLRIAGRTALNVRDTTTARTFFAEALQLSREADEEETIGDALRGLGDVATAEGDSERARSLYGEARTASEAAGNDWSLAAILSSLAHLALTESRWEEAYTCSTEAVAGFRAIGDRSAETSGLVNVGLSALRLGMLPEARSALSAVVADELSDPEAVASALDSIAWLVAEAGHALVAAELLGCSDALFDHVGASRWAPEQALQDDVRLQLSRLMSPGELDDAIRRGRDLSPEAAGRLALAALD